jgi:acyl-CoA hydrolase
MEGLPPSESRATLALWMGPQEANVAGFVHGGIVMKLCDEAAGLAAVKHSRQRIVTFAASVNAVWHTSMEVGVRVDAENPLTGERRHTNTAFLTIVAVDIAGRPIAVPPLALADAEAERRAQDAEVRRANRLAERERLRAFS